MDTSFIKEQIDKWGQCKTIAMTETGVVAIYGDNGYAQCGNVPKNLVDTLAQLNADKGVINEVVFKEDGGWLIIYDNYNAVLSYFIPNALYDAIGEAQDLGLQIFCADWRQHEDGNLYSELCVNDKSNMHRRSDVVVYDDRKTSFIAERRPAFYNNRGATYKDNYSWLDFMYDKKGDGTPSYDYVLKTYVHNGSSKLGDIVEQIKKVKGVDDSTVADDLIANFSGAVGIQLRERISRRVGLFRHETVCGCIHYWELILPNMFPYYYCHTSHKKIMKFWKQVEKADPFYAIEEGIVQNPWRLKIFGTKYFLSNETGTEYYYYL